MAAVLALPAQASSGGRIDGSSLPLGKANGGSLTYDTFTTSSCSQDGFSTNAIARMTLAGHVVVSGQTLLDGVSYDSFSEDLETGPATFDTKFLRPRENDPPFGASSSTYTFVFNANVINEGRRVGTVVTTITCTSGAMTAASVWSALPEPVPALPPFGWALLALLLASAASLRLNRRRA